MKTATKLGPIPFALQQIYDSYVAYCKRLGIQPAPFDKWRVFSKL